MKIINYDTNKKLVLFFTLTLLWTWFCGFMPVILGIVGTPLGTFLFYFGGGAPTVVGLTMVFITYPIEARKDYFKRCFSIKRMGIKWPLRTVLFFMLIALIGLLISRIMGMTSPGMNWIKIILQTPYMIPVLLFFSIISGPLNEEFGWRGYALDKLLIRFNFFGASLILGFIWAIWHLAWYFTPGQAQYEMLQSSVLEALLFIPAVILLSFVVTFVYINTQRSILAGSFVHLTSNFFAANY
ncbi:CPBP family intramembrane glutamic endopeptidase [Acetobacterium woodii]|uniref:Putative membrane protein n=1 Tax=Acetobacterium woodii (strain ATCC 29683 / DSM 1030 / JCM 2381 / KCTC 1655 / WB1) TaxID=931626 RepID=H6LBZ0_ACEWD|nr:type II CAAX endopeptidase family protein [Acetobacterium woodii]AFA47733.1 putative membrane protein [Acetobacterium woodii DSM 1030]